MAFDMWFDCDNEKINCQISHEDERILRLAEGNTNFQRLLGYWITFIMTQ